MSQWLRRYWREALLAAAWLLPIVSLLVFGVMWLRANQALLPWLLGAGLLALAAWPVRRNLRLHLKRQTAEFVAQEAKPLAGWSEHELKAMEIVKEIAQTTDALSFMDAAAARDLAFRTVQAVARHYHPSAQRPELSIPVPDALLLTERVVRDLREEILAAIPFSRSITVGTLVQVADKVGIHGPKAKLAYEVADQVYNAVLLFTNPPAAAARFARGHMAAQIGTGLLGSAKSKATSLFVLRVGREAIELYSGRLSHSDRDLAAASQDDIKAVEPAMAPPRLVLAGQLKAGKSSLVNALAGEILCEVQTVPTPVGPKEHILSIEGKDCGVLVDMPGITNDDGSRSGLIEAVHRCDLIIWVISAVNPGRDIDIRSLEALQEEFKKAPHRRPPPIVVALTHVDRLSPASEWSPPYDFVDPSRPKEQTIRLAMEHVAKTLDVPLDAIVPVAMRPGADPWKVEYLWARVCRDLKEAQYRQLERLRLKGNDWGDVLGQVRHAVGRLVTFVTTKP